MWYLAYVIVLLSFNVDPQQFTLGVLAAMLVPILSIITIILSIYQLLKRKLSWNGFIAAVLLLTSLFQLSKMVAINNEPTRGEIKVISFNASFFRIPTVYSEAYFKPDIPTTNDKMIDWILEQDADYLFIQEFFNDEKSPYFNNLDAIMERGGYVDHYYINKPRHDNGTSRGLIVFSKSPILKKRQLFLGENRFNGATEVLTTWNEDTIRLVNVHLKSSAFNLRKNLKSVGGIIHETKKFFNDGKLKAKQTNLILDEVEDNELPTIVCGDFNSTRYSYVIDKIKGRYKNAFEEVGNGFGFTFLGWFRMPLKLDHQFCSEQFEPQSIEVVDSEAYSDHFSCSGDVYLEKLITSSLPPCVYTWQQCSCPRYVPWQIQPDLVLLPYHLFYALLQEVE